FLLHQPPTPDISTLSLHDALPISRGVELLSGWTYSHTIDDSTDLSTLLNPQNNNNPHGERGNSDFDQRHRWITSAVFQSPSGKRSEEHTSELQSRSDLVCRLLLEK